MILFSILAIMAIVAVLLLVVIGGLLGGISIITFGDVIVCVAIIIWLCKLIIKRRNSK